MRTDGASKVEARLADTVSLLTAVRHGHDQHCHAKVRVEAEPRLHAMHCYHRWHEQNPEQPQQHLQ